MKKNGVVVSIAALVLAASMGSAVAAPRQSGMYLDANVGTLYATTSLFGIQYTKYGSIGANANLGYQFNQYIATEAGYTIYNFDGHSANNIDIATKFILPFNVGTNDFSVFAKLGAADVFSGGDHSVMALAGLGGSYAVTQKTDLTLQAQGVSNGFFSLGLISAGVSYHFD